MLGARSLTQDRYITFDDDDYVLEKKMFDVEYVVIHRKFEENIDPDFNIALVCLKSVVVFTGIFKPYNNITD